MLDHVQLFCDSMDCSSLRLHCPWDFPGRDTGVSCHFLLQGIFLTQESNSCILHCRWILYCLATRKAQGYFRQHIDKSCFFIHSVTLSFDSTFNQFKFSISSVQLLTHVQLFVTPWTAACQVSLSITNSLSLLKLMSIESMIPSNHLILCCPILLLPSIFLSNRVFSNESVLCLRGPKYWSFSFSISLSNVYSGLISFRTDWFDLAIQGTHKSLLQHHSSKASILQHSAFFMVHLSHSYMTIGNGIALAIQTCVSKVMFLLFNMLSRFVIAFLTRSVF